MPNLQHIISDISEATSHQLAISAGKVIGEQRKSRRKGINNMDHQLVTQSAHIGAGRMSQKLALILVIVLLSASGLDAIVKQQQARSDDSSAQPGQAQQSSAISSIGGGSSGSVSIGASSSSGAASSAANNNGPVSYSPSGPSSGLLSSSGSSGSARSQSGAMAQSAGSQSVANSVHQQQQHSDPSQSMMSSAGYSSGSANNNNNNNKQNSYQNYGSDQMMAAASSPDQSYQAAAQSVNMALANSGIFGHSSSSGQAQGQQQQQQAQQGSDYNSQSGLNPLHYFYYPAAKEASAQGGSSVSSSKPADLMGAATSANHYAGSAPASSSYSDQYQGQGLGQMQSTYGSQFGGPEMAASSQDASYLPQPQQQQHQQSAGGQSQQHQLDPNQQHQHQQQQQASQMYMPNGGAHQMGAFGQQAGGPQQADNFQGSPSAASSSISFNGPSSAGGPPQMGPNQDSAFMNSHLNGHQAQYGAQNQGQNSNAAGNFFSQLGGASDLSTSNFGNMPSSGIGSIASYMAPPTQQQQQQQQPQPHDSLFSSQSSAASQLSPAAVAPPMGQQQGQQQTSQQASSSLFSAANSLFGPQAQQQAQQQPNGNSNNNNYLAASQHYLSSFLTPQQYSQLTGQQLGDYQQHPLFGGAAQQALGMAGSSAMPSSMPVPSGSSPGSQTAAVTSSSKRFGLSSLVMPVLALAGLSLLIPTMSNIGTAAMGRKKRSILEEKASISSRQQQLITEPMNGSARQLAKESVIGDYLEKLQRYYAIYQNAVENDDCMNRLICEFGDAVKDLTGNGAMIHVVESFAPSWMKAGGDKMQVFKEAASSGASSKDKCKKYSCQRGGPAGSRQH